MFFRSVTINQDNKWMDRVLPSKHTRWHDNVYNNLKQANMFSGSLMVQQDFFLAKIWKEIETKLPFLMKWRNICLRYLQCCHKKNNNEHNNSNTIINYFSKFITFHWKIVLINRVMYSWIIGECTVSISIWLSSSIDFNLPSLSTVLSSIDIYNCAVYNIGRIRQARSNAICSGPEKLPSTPLRNTTSGLRPPPLPPKNQQP